MNRVALIDADLIAYRAAFRGQKDIDWDGDGDITTDADIDVVRASVDELITEWKGLVKCDGVQLVQSDPERRSFRKTYVWEGYKRQRQPASRPALLKQAEAYIRERFTAIYRPWLEGDDILGLLTTRAPDQYVIVSMDKDMLTVPGRVCIVGHTPELTRKFQLSEADANLNWMRQVVTGDPSDGYRGAPGVGAVKAQDYVKAGTLADMWQGVVEAYIYAWNERPRFRDRWVHPEEPAKEALMTARLSRVLRADDKIENRVRLWSAPGEEETWIDLPS